jgi:hypothetical protein
MVYHNQNYWAFGLSSSSGQWKKSKSPVILTVVPRINTSTFTRSQKNRVAIIYILTYLLMELSPS